MVDLISKQIMNTDLFRVFSPKTSSLNIGARFSCPLSDIPSVGEKVILDDNSAIAVPDGGVLGEMYTFNSLLGEPSLRNYLFGRTQHKSSYRITSVDAGVWSPGVEQLRRLLERMTGDRVWSEDLSHQMGYSGGLQQSLGNLRHAGVYRCAMWRMNDPDIGPGISELQATPPPTRVSIPRQGSPYGTSLLYVTKAEKGAEILMGWRSHGVYERMHGERSAIAKGMVPAIAGITGASAHVDHWYGVNQFTPFGMTGDVTGVRIDPNGPSLCVDDWGRTNSAHLWSIVQEKLGKVGIERLFSEGAVMSARAKAPYDRFRDPDFKPWGTNVIASPMHNPERNLRYHPVETGAFLVHHVKLVDEVPRRFPVAFGSPLAFVALRGKMMVESPHGLQVRLRLNQAAFVPAMRHGDFMTQAREGSAEFFVVHGVSNPTTDLIARSGD